MRPLAAATGVLLVLATPRAGAQDERAAWIVLPAVVGDTPLVMRTSQRIREAHVERGALVRTQDAIRRAAARTAPTRLAEATPEELAGLTRAVEVTLDHLVEGRNSDAGSEAEITLNRLRERMPAIVATDDGARSVAVLCLYVVRAFHAARRAEDAETRAVECLRMLPDLADLTVERDHPRDVRNLVAAQREAMRRNGAVLVVRAATHDPEGCPILLNGRRIGESPEARAEIPGGGSYAVSVACAPGSAMAIQTVSAAARGETIAPIHATLFDALHTDGEVRLVYASAEERDARSAAHAAHVAAMVEATAALVVHEGAEGQVQVDHVRLPEATRQCSDVVGARNGPPTADDARALLISIVACRSGGATPPALRVESRPDEGGGGTTWIAPVALMAAGAAMLGVAAYGLATVGDCLDMDVGRCSERAQFASPAMWLWTGAGIAALGAGVAWLLVVLPSGDDASPGPAAGFRLGGRF